MKSLLRFLPLFACLLTALPAAEDPLITAVRAADDERVAATIGADPARLDAIFSAELHYAHSSGKIDTKASYRASIVSHSTVYESVEYVQRNFLPAAPGIVLMTGRAIIKAGTSAQRTANDLNFLAVWREEGGHWRFLAWQSCKNPPTAPGAPAK